MIKIRLEGLLEEINKALPNIEKTFRVLNVTDPYQNRNNSKYVRVYIDVELKKGGDGNGNI